MKRKHCQLLSILAEMFCFVIVDVGGMVNKAQAERNWILLNISKFSRCSAVTHESENMQASKIGQ